MQSSKTDSCDVWTAESLITRLNKAHQDGTLSDRWNTKDLDIDQITKTLSTLETQIERKDFV